MTVQEFRDQFEIEGDGKKIWCKKEGEFSEVIEALKDMGYEIYDDTENSFDEYPFLGHDLDNEIVAWRNQVPEECISYESFMDMYHYDYLGEKEPGAEAEEDPAEAEAKFLSVLMPG